MVSLALPLTVSTVTLIGSLMTLRAAWGRDFWFVPATWFAAAWAIIFVGRPLRDQIVNDVRLEKGIYIGAHYPDALYVGTLGLIAFVVPFLVRPSAADLACTKYPQGPRVPEFLTMRVAIALGLSSALFGIFVMSNGGLGLLATFYQGRSEQTREAFLSSSGYTYSAPLWLVGIGVYLYALGRARGASAMRIFGIVLVGVSQALTLGAGDRSYFLPAILSLVTVRLLQDRIVPRMRWIAVLMPVVMVFGILLPNLYRNYDRIGGEFDSAFKQALENPFSQVWEGDDTAMARNFSIELAGVPNSLPYALGESYLAIPLRPVPRQFFPEGKPKSGDAAVNDQLITMRTGLTTGFSYSIFGEPYYNFGVPGVIAIMTLFALVWRKAWFAFLRRRDDPLALALYSAALPVLAVMVRGGIGVDYQRLMFTVLPLFILMAPKLTPRSFSDSREVLRQART